LWRQQRSAALVASGRSSTQRGSAGNWLCRRLDARALGRRLLRVRQRVLPRPPALALQRRRSVLCRRRPGSSSRIWQRIVCGMRAVLAQQLRHFAFGVQHRRLDVVRLAVQEGQQHWLRNELEA
jgi:hypothetical protein